MRVQHSALKVRHWAVSAGPIWIEFFADPEYFRDRSTFSEVASQAARGHRLGDMACLWMWTPAPQSIIERVNISALVGARMGLVDMAFWAEQMIGAVPAKIRASCCRHINASGEGAGICHCLGEEWIPGDPKWDRLLLRAARCRDEISVYLYTATCMTWYAPNYREALELARKSVLMFCAACLY
jgi:hypothetical protein